MQIRILDDAGIEWANFRRQHPGSEGGPWMDEEGDRLDDRYQATLTLLEATVQDDPYWIVAVNRGELSK